MNTLQVTRWYTCSKGHKYGIGDCGQPVGRGNCPDCGEPIGAGKRTHAFADGRNAQQVFHPKRKIVYKRLRELFRVGRWLDSTRSIEMFEGPKVRQSLQSLPTGCRPGAARRHAEGAHLGPGRGQRPQPPGEGPRRAERGRHEVRAPLGHARRLSVPRGRRHHSARSHLSQAQERE